MTEDLLSFLHRNPELFYCPLCVARGSQLPLQQLGEAWARLVTHKAVQITEGHCSHCLQVRTVARVKGSGAAAA